ncbi:MAG: hypothetical protein WCD66_07855 [Rhodanobacteraceae bacterium]
MRMEKLDNPITALGLTLLLGTVGGAMDATAGSRAVGAQDRPLALQQAAQIPDLQPDKKSGLLTSSGRAFQGKSIIVGNWRIKMDYRATKHGWQFSSYQATRTSGHKKRSEASVSLQPGDHGGQSVLNLIPAFDDFPPGPGDYPQPAPPGDPDNPNHTSVDRQCPYFGTHYDVKVEWKWMPAHEDDDGNFVPGHWEQVVYLLYNEQIDLAPFCK